MKVFLDYTQKELDDAYDQLVYAPGRDAILARMAAASAAARARLGEPERHAYGETPIEALDLYRTGARGAPAVVYVHGGAWRAGLARDYAFAAPMLVGAGAHFAVLDFNNVLETGGSLALMAGQVRRGIAWVCANAARLGADPARVHVAAHSSGAHLAAVAATAGLAVRGFVLASGMYDLRGPRLSKRSAYVKFTDADEDALSPQRHLARIGAPLAVLYGTRETPEFQRQGREFAAALRAAGKSVGLVVAEGLNHFEVAETLADPAGAMGRAVLAQMGLGAR